jgi:hypothetical protein
MEEGMLEDLGQFIFLAAGAIAVFSFLSIGAWSGNRTAERIAVERLALYRKLAESPAESVQLVLAHLREEDERQERKEQDRVSRSRFETRLGGTIVLAAGIGLSIFLWFVAPGQGVWTLGLMVILIGVVIFGFTLVDRKPPARQ